MEKFLGVKYRLVKKENFNDLLFFLGLSFIERKLAETMHPIQLVSKNDDGTYVLHYCSGFISYDTVFIPGQEFDDMRPDRRKFKSLITIEDNKVTHREIDKHGRTLTHVYEFFTDKMIVTSTAKELEKAVVRYYDRVK